MQTRFEVADLGGTKRLELTIKPNDKKPGYIYMEAPRYFLLSKEDALQLTNHLVDLVEEMENQ